MLPLLMKSCKFWLILGIYVRPLSRSGSLSCHNCCNITDNWFERFEKHNVLKTRYSADLRGIMRSLIRSRLSRQQASWTFRRVRNMAWKAVFPKVMKTLFLKKQEIVSNSIKVVVPLGQRNVPFRGAISGIFQANTRMEISIFRSLVG